LVSDILPGHWLAGPSRAAEQDRYIILHHHEFFRDLLMGKGNEVQILVQEKVGQIRDATGPVQPGLLFHGNQPTKYFSDQPMSHGQRSDFQFLDCQHEQCFLDQLCELSWSCGHGLWVGRCSGVFLLVFVLYQSLQREELDRGHCRRVDS
jgi:hypothetical protein